MLLDIFKQMDNGMTRLRQDVGGLFWPQEEVTTREEDVSESPREGTFLLTHHWVDSLGVRHTNIMGYYSMDVIAGHIQDVYAVNEALSEGMRMKHSFMIGE